jgi:hypothetical protein
MPTVPNQPISANRSFPWRGCLVSTTVGLAIASCVLYSFRHHVLWFAFVRSDEIAAIPWREMPESDTPADWVIVGMRGISMRLPPDLADAKVESKATTLVFKRGDRSAAITGVQDESESETAFMSGAKAVDPQHRDWNVPRLRRACCEVDPSDVSWRTSNKVVRWHTFLASMKKNIALSNARCEFRFDDDGELSVQWLGSKDGSRTAIWQFAPKNSKRLATGILKSGGDGGEIWIRQILDSIKPAGENNGP